MLTALDRRDRLDREIEALAANSMFTPVVRRLGCLRGVATLTAFGLAAEIGDWTRLSGRSIGAYLGLVPTEYSSGSTRVQGGVTKTGNSHARRLLAEAAWHHRPSARPGSAPTLGRGLTGGTSTRPSRQCAPARPLGALRCAQEMPCGRQRGDRPRARRLVLVTGSTRRVGPTFVRMNIRWCR